eukprot:jgi/Ulvmu1/10123/UM006_0075.1
MITINALVELDPGGGWQVWVDATEDEELCDRFMKCLQRSPDCASDLSPHTSEGCGVHDRMDNDKHDAVSGWNTWTLQQLMALEICGLGGMWPWRDVACH